MRAGNILDTIGGTPHIRLGRLFPDHEVWLKSERANPGGSIKDRIALAMIEERRTGAAALNDPHIERDAPATGGMGGGLNKKQWNLQQA